MKYFRFLPLAVVVLCLATVPNCAEAQTSPDSLSRQAADTLGTADSVRTTFIPDIGTITSCDSSEFSAPRFIWTDAFSLFDLLNFRPGLLIHRLGAAGQPDLVTIGGIDWRGAALLVDGRPMNDPVTGVENLHDIPLEFIDHVELLTGAESFLHAQNATAATVNIVTRQYNTGRPITKVRFMQGPSEHLLTDAMFSQNIFRTMNLTFGLQRQVTDGRFFNSAYDSWNVRSRLRYNVCGNLNLSLMDLYRRSVTGFNNGVLIDSTRSLGVDPFNEAEAIVSSQQGSQTHTRRDVTLHAIATLFPDSTWTTKAALYYSTSQRDYSDSSSSGMFEHFSWNLAGATVRQALRFEPLSVDLGGQIESRKASFVRPALNPRRNYAAWFGHMSFNVAEVFQPSGFVRGESFGEGKAFSYGASLLFRPVETLELKAAHSRFARFPSLQESSWGLYSLSSPSLNLLERHTLSELTGTLRFGSAFRASAAFSKRIVSNALLFTPASTLSSSTMVIEIVPELSVLQFAGDIGVALWVFDVAGSLTYTEAKKQDVPAPLSPKFVLTGEVSYRGNLFEGALKTRMGIRSRYIGRHDGVRFRPATMVYAENTGRSLTPFSIVDLYGVFNIGDAFINLTWGNVLDKNYLTVYPYPELGRHVRISVNWIFLD